ncbi:MAG: response regulator transcription factor [Chloroflexi bacterium]|nr:response regulator transcription factor [Chloroflexota bacterium]
MLNREDVQRILVVDDSPEIREMLKHVLELEGFDVITAGDGTQGLRALYTGRPSLVISDVGMPEMDGWLFLERLREFTDVPVILLTAYGEERDKVRGLRLGADDYVVKPVQRGELLARVHAILRRTGKAAPKNEAVYQDLALFVDMSRHVVRVRDKAVSLSPQEFRLLSAFLGHPGAVLSPERLMDLSWGTSEGGPENVRVYMGYLRRKIEMDHKNPVLLETIRGFGYRYNPPHESAAA